VPAAAATEVAEKIVRDVRIDQMGFVAELVKQHADVLKTKVKVRMLEDEIDRVTGDYFEGLLVRGKTRTLDPKKLFKLVKSKQITEEQFLGAISVKLPAAEQLLSGNDMAKLCDETDASPQLRASRIKGVELKLVQVVQGLASSIDAR
jgi:hypothetical protein